MGLGRVFAAAPRVGGRVDGCTYCYSGSDLELLGGDPAKVPDRLVSAFATEVIDHWSEDQYGLIWRGLAPRILTLLATEPDDRLLRGLAFAKWPDEEQAAIRSEVHEIVARAFTGEQDPHRLETLICAAAHIDHDLTPWLAYLDTLGSGADAAIAVLAEHWAKDLAAGRRPALVWFTEDLTAPVRDWLYSDALHERLTRAHAEDVKITIARM